MFLFQKTLHSKIWNLRFGNFSSGILLVMLLYQRSIFSRSFWAAVWTIFLFTCILLMGNGIKDLMKLLACNKISYITFYKILGLLIPCSVAYALPIGILTGTLLVFGKLSSQNELVVLKSAGIGLFRISSPVIFLSLLATVVSLAINLYYGPNAISNYRKSISNLIRQAPLNFIQTRTFIKDFPGYVIYIGNREGNQIKDCWLWELDSQKRVNLFIKAKKGNIVYQADKDALVLTLLKGVGEKRSDQHPEHIKDSTLFAILFKQLVISLPLKEILGEASSKKRIGYMTLPELLQERSEILAQKAQLSPQSFLQQKICVQLEIQKNLAMAFSILALVFIAIPLGIKAHRSETFANLALAISLGLGYYFIVIAISWLENKPHFRPDLLVWLPNFAFEAAGIAWFIKANKH